jgi:hydroxyethylthiazole kinase-like uncharacterized protein yjeF
VSTDALNIIKSPVFEAILQDSLAKPDASDNKYSRGVVGFLTGSEKYPGAAVLGVSAAWRTGIGAVRFFGPKSIFSPIIETRPETLVSESPNASPKISCAVVGSGWQDFDSETKSRWQSLCLSTNPDTPMVIDAGALNVFTLLGETERRQNWVLTPHAGELAKLLTLLGHDTTRQFVESNPEETAQLAAKLTGSLVLLKGHTSYLANFDGQLTSVIGNSSHLATAGSGDVLAGIMGALLARNAAEAEKAGKPMPALILVAELAIRLHSEAARRAGQSGPVAAMDIVNSLREVIAEIWKEE